MSRSRKDADPVSQLSVPQNNRDRSVSIGRSVSPGGGRSVSSTRSICSIASNAPDDWIPSSATLTATGNRSGGRTVSPMFRHAATLCPGGGNRNRSKSRPREIIDEASYSPASASVNEMPTEITTFKTSCQIFTQMMTTLQPGKESAQDRKLLQDFSRNCQEMKQRVVQLLESKEYANFTVDLLRLNDDLNIALFQYEKFRGSSEAAAAAAAAASQKEQQKVTSQQKTPPPVAIIVNDDAADNLIDLDEARRANELNAQFGEMRVSSVQS